MTQGNNTGICFKNNYLKLALEEDTALMKEQQCSKETVENRGRV